MSTHANLKVQKLRNTEIHGHKATGIPREGIRGVQPAPHLNLVLRLKCRWIIVSD